MDFFLISYDIINLLLPLLIPYYFSIFLFLILRIKRENRYLNIFSSFL